ncbi:MAG: TIGR04282 family arsenosugar biosynthesis glycosyltransferase [Catalinimonas sp.]
MPTALLLIFVRHPVRGQVKTRLARAVGPDRALAVYERLLDHTLRVTRPLPAVKRVHYAAEIPTADRWAAANYERRPQPTGDLGDRMRTAFEVAFREGHERVVIVGSDCPGLTTGVLESAFEALGTHDVVLGPAEDGGYYLLGMKHLHPELFADKPWSTPQVLANTRADLIRLALTHHELPPLNDVDEATDLPLGW